ncbi:MAG: type II secretion system F family protein [Pirellulaceae bacterium]
MMSLDTAAQFCRRMSIGLRAGVDILRVLENETKSGNPKHRQTMVDVGERIRGGSSLAKAMLENKHYFPPLLIQMVHASELGGRMDGTLAYMADYYESLKQTRTQFVSRISWPLIQLVMAIGIVGGMILLFDLLGVPPSARLLKLSLSTYCISVCSAVGAILLVGYGIWKNWFNCHQFLTPIVQRIPTLGTAFITLALSRLSMTLSMLLNAGVEAKRSTKQAFMATGNRYFMSGVDRALEAVERGASFGDAFDESGVLPREFIESVRIGELSGTETESLDHLALDYQDRAKRALNTIAAIASFTIWILIMIVIGGMVLYMGIQYIQNLTNFANGDF